MEQAGLLVILAEEEEQEDMRLLRTRHVHLLAVVVVPHTITEEVQQVDRDRGVEHNKTG